MGKELRFRRRMGAVQQHSFGGIVAQQRGGSAMASSRWATKKLRQPAAKAPADLQRTQPVGIGLDDGGTFAPANPRLQNAPVVADGAEVDAEHGAGKVLPAFVHGTRWPPAGPEPPAIPRVAKRHSASIPCVSRATDRRQGEQRDEVGQGHEGIQRIGDQPDEIELGDGADEARTVSITRDTVFDRGADQILPALFAVVGPAEDGGEGENGNRDGENWPPKPGKAAVKPCPR